ncbi:helix-turn-helix transcriptional regulator [Caldichromatium japonicum]|uniref:Helix-turn-helix transcriptional regulator n=1 Tax=Caldichromatium japonicum TaxID=2699430 RepID=A0A6G7VAT9_9GAMM|nr:metalloregulator ArsR/SmtB family transcription factor [Caldichromatium japonicum]QIK37131.1 helix-turn-helix transcriptional regulator [Caldichromatium japonicum]
MEHDEAAATLAELGNRHRLAVFRYLVKAGQGGASVGEIQQALGIPLSTLSHHLSRMAHVGLIDQTRHGRAILCVPNYAHLAELLAFIQQECCVGHHGDVAVSSVLSADCDATD